MPSYIGQSIKRNEDPRLITGRGVFSDDVDVPGTLYAAFARSPHGHARIISIDTSAAKAAPGVEAVITGHDLQGVPPIPVGFAPPSAPAVPPNHVLPTQKVVYVGQAVAAVIARDPYQAQDAAQLIEVEYEPLAAVVDPLMALEPGSPQIYAEVPGNLGFTMSSGSNDVEAALKASDEVITLRVVNNRVAVVPLENRAIVAQYDAFDRGLTVTLGTQQPHGDRSAFGRIVGVPENRVRLYAHDVGGGFGAKGNVYPEEAVTALMAYRLRKAVRWSDSRSENLRTMTQGRAHLTEITLGVRRDGTFTALDTKVVADLGGVLAPVGAASVGSIMTMCCGPYKFPVARAAARAVYTNTAPTGPYRGAGRPEATYALERAVDEAARRLNMDPVELRKKNLIEPNQFPYTTPVGPVYDTGNYQAALEIGLKAVDYDHFRAEQRRLRAQGRYVGIGVTTFVEPAGALFWEFAEIRVDRSGKVTVYSGGGPTGQGHETILAQIAASELQVPVESIEVVHGDTGAVAMGVGSFGSRSTILGGSATLHAAQQVREKMRAVAAGMLEARVDDIQLDDGRFHVAGNPARGLDFGAIAGFSYFGVSPAQEPGISARESFQMNAVAYPFGTHICIAEVNPENGEITIQRYLGVDDCGTMINPMLVAGQLHGGFAQGFGEAMMEQVLYDSDGQLLTGSLMDYAVPKASQVPPIEFLHTVTPSPLDPLGAKGVGEAGCIASPPTLVNAVLDALAPLGVTHVDMPLTAPRVWAAIQAAKGGK